MLDSYRVGISNDIRVISTLWFSLSWQLIYYADLVLLFYRSLVPGEP